MAAPQPGTIHIYTAGAVSQTHRAKTKASGWAMAVHKVQQDGSEKEILRANGAVPAKCTHKDAPPHAETKHTLQAARQAAIEAALAYSTRMARNGRREAITITVDNITTLRNLHSAEAFVREREDNAQGETEGSARTTKRPRAEPRGTKRRSDSDATTAERQPRAVANVRQLHRMTSNVLIRAPTAATSLELVTQAQNASRRRDTDARVHTSNGDDRTGPVWAENRTWDPGD